MPHKHFDLLQLTKRLVFITSLGGDAQLLTKINGISCRVMTGAVFSVKHEAQLLPAQTFVFVTAQPRRIDGTLCTSTILQPVGYLWQKAYLAR